MKKDASEKLIETVPNIPDTEKVIEENKTKPVKPYAEQMRKQKLDEVKTSEGLVSPELIVEWAMRDAESNHNDVLSELDRLADDYGITKEQKEAAHAYYDKIRARDQRDAALLYRVVDETGKGFKNFREALKYMTLDLPKDEVYRLKRTARKAGLLSGDDNA